MLIKKNLVCVVLAVGSVAAFAKTPDYQAVIDQAYANYQVNNQGQVANYIPALAKYSPHLYGIALVTVDGKVYTAGDAKAKFPLESVAKIFSLGLALQQFGSDVVLDKLGSNATGLPFNSVMAVEQQPNRTGNGLVNAGAMAVVSMLQAKDKDSKWQLMMTNFNNYADASLTINNEVYQSEMATNEHNQAIAKLLQSYGHFYSNTEDAVDLYTKECSVEANTIDLAKMGAVFANGGKSPFNHKQLLDAKLVPNLLAEMATAGMYDSSGDWLYSVGLPTKSGVSGDMVAVYPGKFAIAVYSPPLDSYGNSVRGQAAIKYIATQLGANIFNSTAK